MEPYKGLVGMRALNTAGEAGIPDPPELPPGEPRMAPRASEC